MFIPLWDCLGFFPQLYAPALLLLDPLAVLINFRVYPSLFLFFLCPLFQEIGIPSFAQSNA